MYVTKINDFLKEYHLIKHSSIQVGGKQIRKINLHSVLQYISAVNAMGSF